MKWWHLRKVAIAQCASCTSPTLRYAQKGQLQVTDAPMPIVSVKRGADSGALTSFKLHDGGTRDAAAIQNIAKILNETEGFNVVHEHGAHVWDTKTSQSSSERFVQPVITNSKLEQALSQAAKEYERKQHTLETEEHEKLIHQPDKKAARKLANTHEPTQQERTEYEGKHCSNRAWCEIYVSVTSLDGQHGRQNRDEGDRVRLHIRDRSNQRSRAKSGDHGRQIL